jgi:hypothetical protein
MRRGLVAMSAGVLLSLMAVPAAAHPVDPHNHFLTVPGTGTEVQVGPERCGLASTVETAFHAFHHNVHIGQPSSTGVLSIRPERC